MLSKAIGSLPFPWSTRVVTLSSPNYILVEMARASLPYPDTSRDPVRMSSWPKLPLIFRGRACWPVSCEHGPFVTCHGGWWGHVGLSEGKCSLAPTIPHDGFCSELWQSPKPGSLVTHSGLGHAPMPTSHSTGRPRTTSTRTFNIWALKSSDEQLTAAAGTLLTGKPRWGSSVPAFSTTQNSIPHQ